MGVIIIPGLLLLINITNSWGLLGKFLGFEKIDSIVDILYSSEPKILKTAGEFNSLLRLVKKNTQIDLASQVPVAFGRFKTFSIQDMGPKEDESFFIPHTTRVAVLLEPYEMGDKSIPREYIKIIGTLGEIEDWVRQYKQRKVDLVTHSLSLLSIIVGTWINFASHRKNKSNKI